MIGIEITLTEGDDRYCQITNCCVKTTCIFSIQGMFEGFPYQD